jgi:hypothetical protein
MGRPFRPVRELEAHLERGELDSAVVLARGIAGERGRSLDLNLSLRFLPLVARQRPERYDSWALRWLEQWCAQMRDVAGVEESVDVASALVAIAEGRETGLARAAQLADNADAAGD